MLIPALANSNQGACLGLSVALTLAIAAPNVGCGSSSGEATHGTSQASSTAAATTTASASSTASAATSAPRPERVAVEVPNEIRAIIDSADRSPEDKALDAGRHPDEMLAFFGVAPGQRVAELGAGGGYTAELLARTVGPKGKVFGQNNKTILEKFAEKPWSERLNKPIMKNVVRVDREFDDPLPKEAKDLDGVIVVLFYHDLYWMGTDRAKMNKAVFDALKPGGFYGIVDHTAAAGAGDTQVKTLHRIEESAVRADIEASGFVFVKAGDFLRNPSDTLDWNDAPGAAGDKRGTSDRFVLVFQKPK